MELAKGGLFISRDYHRFLPYRHHMIDNMWMVLQFRDIHHENAFEQSDLVRTVEHKWSVIADTPLLAALGAQKSWERDRELSYRYGKRRSALNDLFEELRNMTISSIKKFNEMIEPLMNELEKRNKDAEFVSDAVFYSNLIIMINRFNEIVKETIKKDKNNGK